MERTVFPAQPSHALVQRNNIFKAGLRVVRAGHPNTKAAEASSRPGKPGLCRDTLPQSYRKSCLEWHTLVDVEEAEAEDYEFTASLGYTFPHPPL